MLTWLQLLSLDITLLRGFEKWQFYFLYVIIDVFSRHVVDSRLVRGRLWVLVTPRLARRKVTGFETSGVPRSAWKVS